MGQDSQGYYYSDGQGGTYYPDNVIITQGNGTTYQAPNVGTSGPTVQYTCVNGVCYAVSTPQPSYVAPAPAPIVQQANPPARDGDVVNVVGAHKCQCGCACTECKCNTPKLAPAGIQSGAKSVNTFPEAEAPELDTNAANGFRLSL